MYHLSTENGEISVNNNELETLQGVVSCDCVSDKTSYCDANPVGGDEDESKKTACDKIKSCCNVGAINDDENKQSYPNPEKDSKGSKEIEVCLDLPALNIFKQEGAENLIDRNATRSGKAGRSVKDGGYSSLVSFCKTSFTVIFWQLLIYFTFGILFRMPSAGVEGALTSYIPINTLVVVGQAARMNCATDFNRPVYWARTLVGSDDEQWLYYGFNGLNGNNADGKFTIGKDEATGRYDLIIADVQPNDAGQYICIDESGIGATASAELVVSDTEFASKDVDACPGVKWNLLCNPQCSYHFDRKDNYCQCLYTFYDTRTQQKYEVTSDAVGCVKDNAILPAVVTALLIATTIIGLIFLVYCVVKKRTTRSLHVDDSGESGQNDNENAFVEPMLR